MARGKNCKHERPFLYGQRHEPRQRRQATGHVSEFVPLGLDDVIKQLRAGGYRPRKIKDRYKLDVANERCFFYAHPDGPATCCLPTLSLTQIEKKLGPELNNFADAGLGGMWVEFTMDGERMSSLDAICDVHECHLAPEDWDESQGEYRLLQKIFSLRGIGARASLGEILATPGTRRSFAAYQKDQPVQIAAPLGAFKFIKSK